MESIPDAIPWIGLAGAVETIALTFLRVGGFWNCVIAGVIFAVGVVPLLSKALEFTGIGMANFLWNVLSTITLFSVGIFFFSEKLTKLKLIGILVALFGIGLILIAE